MRTALARRAASRAVRPLSTRSAESVDVVVCGAGVVGVACAHYLAREHGARVALVDLRPPLSLTSALSTECYRNYWGGHAPMTAFMDRSIDLLEQRAAECANAFNMNRRGYVFLSATADGAIRHEAAARAAGGAVLSGGAHGVAYDPSMPYDAACGAPTAFLGRDAVGAFFGALEPFVSSDVTSVLHAGRAGWMNAQQMGSHLLGRAREAGVRIITPASLAAVETDSTGRVCAAVLARGSPAGGELRVPCGAVVNAAGPFAAAVSESLTRGGGAPLPLRNEVHAKVMLRDLLRTIPSESPMMIWEDEVALKWEPDEVAELTAMGGFEASLASALPAGCHFRPYPGASHTVLMLWEALHADVIVPEPPPAEPALRETALLTELMLRGLAHMVPRLGEYVSADGSVAASVVADGGYYTQTPDNLPLIGALPDAPGGAYVCAGLSGYGVMAANGAGELLALHVANGANGGAPLPGYAAAFAPERWLSAEYRESVASGAVGKGLQI